MQNYMVAAVGFEPTPPKRLVSLDGQRCDLGHKIKKNPLFLGNKIQIGAE